MKKGEDFKRVDEEAQRVAKAAVAALHAKSKALKGLKNRNSHKFKENILSLTKKPKLKIKSGSKSSSALERIRSRRNIQDEIAAPLTVSDENIFKKSKLNPNYKLAQKLRDFLSEKRGGVKTDTLGIGFEFFTFT